MCKVFDVDKKYLRELQKLFSCMKLLISDASTKHLTEVVSWTADKARYGFGLDIHDCGGDYYAYIKDFEGDHDDGIRSNHSRAHEIQNEECIRIFEKQDDLIAKSQPKNIIQVQLIVYHLVI